jgi:hypothetical protein
MYWITTLSSSCSMSDIVLHSQQFPCKLETLLVWKCSCHIKYLYLYYYANQQQNQSYYATSSHAMIMWNFANKQVFHFNVDVNGCIDLHLFSDRCEPWTDYSFGQFSDAVLYFMVCQTFTITGKAIFPECHALPRVPKIGHSGKPIFPECCTRGRWPSPSA